MAKPLDNPRHELFAQALATGMTADAAYVIAGFKANRGNAARLNANESTKARIAELQAEAAERTIEKIALSDADFINRLVREADHYGEGSSHSARVSAVKLIGEHLGLLRQKIEHIAPDRLTQALIEISRAGSAAPIATARKAADQ